MRRVVVTGIGVVSALGPDTGATWDGIVEGRTGVGPLRAFDPSALGTHQGAEIVDFDPTRFANRKALKIMTRDDQLALAAAVLAVDDSGLDVQALEPERCGLFTAGGKEVSNLLDWVPGLEATLGDAGTPSVGRMAENLSQFPPLFFVQGLQASSLFFISERYGMKGHNAYFSGTADAGATAIGRAFRAVRRGDADVVLAGGQDTPVSWWMMSRLDPLGVLSTRNELGPAAFRAYDVDHSGSLPGEGAAFVMLEEARSAAARGAPIYAEVAGFAGAFDPYGTLTPDPSGAPLADAIRRALREAAVDPEDVDYVAADGSARAADDASEARALAAVFARRTRPIPSSSVKAATGHLMAAAGALNVAVAALATRTGTIPPTLHLERIDPACRVPPVDWVPRDAREARVRHALAVARGLEGQNVALVLRSA